MAAYDPQRNRSRRRPADVTDEPAAVDALLGPVDESERSPDPVAVAVNDEVVTAAAEPLAGLRAVPDPEPAPGAAASPRAVPEPEPVAEPEGDEGAHVSGEAGSESAPAPARSPAARIAAAILAALAVLALLLAWARRRR